MSQPFPFSPGPSGVCVPASLIVQPAIPSAVLTTWIKLRSLAGVGDETLPLSIPKLAEITGRRRSSLYKHLAFLRARDALTWRSCGKGSFIVSFVPEYCPAGQPDSTFLDLGQPQNDSIILEVDSSHLDTDSKILECDSKNLEDDSRNLETHSRNLENDSRNLKKDSINLERDSNNLEILSRNLEDHSNNLENDSRNLENRSNNLEMHPPSIPPPFFLLFFTQNSFIPERRIS